MVDSGIRIEVKISKYITLALILACLLALKETLAKLGLALAELLLVEILAEQFDLQRGFQPLFEDVANLNFLEPGMRQYLADAR